MNHKNSLKRYKIIEIIPSILSDHHGLRLIFNNNISNRKPTFRWKLKTTKKMHPVPHSTEMLAKKKEKTFKNATKLLFSPHPYADRTSEHLEGRTTHSHFASSAAQGASREI